MNRFFNLWPLFILLLTGSPCFANPSQFGSTGLLSQPVAETLNAGNICLGVWGVSSGSSETSDGATILPVAITLGLGTFMEAYGSFPSLLFNDEELDSGRGYANLGLKLRVYGKRSSALQLAIDAQGRKTISNNPDYEGLTDLVGRIVASYKPGETYGIHGNLGYVINDGPKGLSFDDQILVGAGIEFFPVSRIRLLAEYEMQTEKISGQGAFREGTAGVQFYLSPHLTLNLGMGVGLSDPVADWKLLVGLSTCQGVGSYLQPIPRILEEPPPVEEKVVPTAPRIRVLTPLIPGFAVNRQEVSSRFEVPVKEASPITVYPRESVSLSAPEAVVKTGAAVSPISLVADAPTADPAVVGQGKETSGYLYRKFVLPELAFDFDQWSLSDEGRRAISEIAELLRKDEHWVALRLDGHTDSVGSDRYNERLSLKRAISFAMHFVSHAGIDPSRIFVKGFGERMPLADNETSKGRSQNRRVEILVLTARGDGH